MQLRTILASSSACLKLSGLALSLGLVGGTATAQDLAFTEAERTPLACDRQLSVDDLANWEVPKPNKPYKIAISVPSFANPYIQALIYGAELAAKEAGVTITVGAGRGWMDPASQITQFENAMTRGPDAFLINPADPAGLALTIEDAVANGVPVVEVGTLSRAKTSLKVVQDDYSQGVAAADALAGLVSEGATGIVMGGPANASWSRGRVAGFLDAVDKNDSINVSEVVSTDIDPQQGLTRFSNAAQANPQVDWIYAVGSFLLAPQSIPEEYVGATYLGGTLTSVTLEALQDGGADGILPDFPISVGYVGLSLAIAELNGDKNVQTNCIPNEIMGAADLADSVWIDSSILPDDWQVPE
jgi:ABC-type sugar transport system substrate-binding protein